MTRPLVALGAAVLTAACIFGVPGVGVATASQAAEEPPPEEPPSVLGAPSAFDLGATREGRVQVAAGARVYERPDPAAGVLAIVDSAAELPVIARRTEWIRVRYAGFKGWIWNGDEPLPDPSAGSPAEVGETESGAPGNAAVAPGSGDRAVSSAAPRPVARSYGPDPQAVARARQFLGDAARELDAGPWHLLTDVRDERLLASLDRLAGELPAAYRELYGLPVDFGASAGDSGPEDAVGASGALGAPQSAGTTRGSDVRTGTDRAVIVLFSREAAYRSFLGDGAAFGPDGYTTNGIAALYRGDMADDDLRVLFAHEVVHLLDWRVLEGRAPEWLEEGLAQALAVSRIEPSGAIHAEELGDGVRVVSESVSRDGRLETTLKVSAGYEAIRAVAQGLRRGELPRFEELAASRPFETEDPSVRPLRYHQCALVVRYLLQAEDGRWRDGFHRYLAGLAHLAQGGDGSPGSLPAVLGTDWETLEQGFSRWVQSRDVRLAGPRRLPDRVLGRNGWRTNPPIATAASGPAGAPDGSSGLAPDPARLARAMELLGHPAGKTVGPWTLYTDVHDRRLLRSLDRLAGETVRAYEDRFGLDPGLSGAPTGPGGGAVIAPEVVILFAHENEHDAFLGEGAPFSAREVGGSAGSGLAVLQRGERSAKELRVLLVHELVHLLSRRALGTRAPPWLEEGLADALAFSRITPTGRLHADDLGGETVIRVGRLYGLRSQLETTVASTGPRAAIERLVAALDRNRLPPLESLTARSWNALVNPRWRQLGYAQSAMFVRFLLDGEDGRWLEGFRAYLRGIAAGEASAGAPDALLAALGTDWQTLDSSFGHWVRSQQIAGRM